MVSSFIQVKWKITLKKTPRTKQIHKQKTKQKDKKQTKRYYVTFLSHLIRVLIQTVLY
jgi:hypothetical protein